MKYVCCRLDLYIAVKHFQGWIFVLLKLSVSVAFNLPRTSGWTGVRSGCALHPVLQPWDANCKAMKGVWRALRAQGSPGGAFYLQHQKPWYNGLQRCKKPSVVGERCIGVCGAITVTVIHTSSEVQQSWASHGEVEESTGCLKTNNKPQQAK